MKFVVVLLAVAAVGLTLRDVAFVGSLNTDQTLEEQVAALNPELWLKEGEGYWDDAGKSDPSIDNEAVHVWEDQSGNGNDAVQATGADQPTLQVDEWGNNDVLVFDGSTDFMDTSLTPGATTTMVIVYKSDVDEVSSVAYGSQHTVNDDRAYIGINASEYIGGGVGDQTYATVNTTLGGDRAYHHVMVLRDAGNAKIYVDGFLEKTQAISNDCATTYSQYVGAVNIADSASLFYDGNIVEILHWDSTLSSGNIDTVEAYLDDKFWGQDRTFTPSTTPVLWLAADQRVHTDSADDSVIDWFCKETGAEFDNPTTSEEPTYTASLLDGYGGADFDGGTDMLLGALDGGAVTQPFTYYIVLKQESWTDFDYVLVDDNTLRGILVQKDAQYALDMYSGNWGPTIDPGDTSFHLYRCLFNGSSSELEVDNTTEDTSGGVGTGVIDGLCIGGRYDDTAQSDVQVIEIMVFDSDHDTTEIHTYFDTKFPTLGLP